MSALSVQVTYRKGKPLAAYLYLGGSPGRRSARTEEVGPDLLVDFAGDGSPIGIEIVSPGSVTVDEIHAVFDRLGIARPAPVELSPLRAA